MNGLNGRQAAVFACGILMGAAAAAWMLMQKDAPAPTDPVAKAAQPASAAAPATAALPQSTRCDFEPVIAPAGDADGTQRMPSDLAGPSAAQIPPLLVTGKENAAAGRPRNAEVAFLTACRVARELGPSAAGAYADAKYQLGRHYAVVARGGEASPAEQAELLQRSRLLYTDALGSLRALHGETHEKTRFAAQGLAAVEQAVAGAGAAEEAGEVTRVSAPQAQPETPAKPEPVAKPVKVAERVQVTKAAEPAKVTKAAKPVTQETAAAPATQPAPAIVRAPPLPEPVAKSPPTPRRATVAARRPPAPREAVTEEPVSVEAQALPSPRPRPEPLRIEEPPGEATGSAGAAE